MPFALIADFTKCHKVQWHVTVLIVRYTADNYRTTEQTRKYRKLKLVFFIFPY